MFRLCLGGEGQFIRNPNEIRYEWSFEDVVDAHDVLDYIAELNRRERVRLKSK